METNRNVTAILMTPTLLSACIGDDENTCEIDTAKHLFPWSVCHTEKSCWLEDLLGQRIEKTDALHANVEELTELAESAIEITIENCGKVAKGEPTYEGVRTFVVALSAELHGVTNAKRCLEICDKEAERFSMRNEEMWFEIVPKLEEAQVLYAEEIRMAFGSPQTNIASASNVPIGEIDTVISGLPNGLSGDQKREFIMESMRRVLRAQSSQRPANAAIPEKALARQIERCAEAHTRVLFDHGMPHTHPEYGRAFLMALSAQK